MTTSKRGSPEPGLLEKLVLDTTSITVYELLYGVQKSGKTSLINRLLRYVTVVPLDESAARKAAGLDFDIVPDTVKGVNPDVPPGYPSP